MPGESGAAQPSSEAHAETLSLVRQACTAYGRSDLAEVVDAAEERLRQPYVRVVIVGEFKKGKSTLVNALLGGQLCPTDDDVPTGVPTVVHHAEVASAAAVHRVGGGALARVDLPMDQVWSTVTAAPGDDAPVAVEIGLPRRLLALGLQVMDTPGLGGLVSAHAVATLAAAATADAVLFVTDALQELTAPEVDTLRALTERCDEVAVAVTKVDIAPAWHQIVALDQAHLAAAGVSARILPLAAPLRQLALENRDAELSTESGYDALALWLIEVARTREAVMARAAARELHRVIGLVEQPLATELAVLDDPQQHAEVVAELERTKERVTRLKQDSAGWQQTLNDRVADLQSSVDHELRRRLRETTRNAERRLEDVDPGAVWAEFEPWLRRRVADDVGAVLAELQDRATGVVREVLQRFADEEGLAEATAPIPGGVLRTPMSRLEVIDVGVTDTDGPGLLATGLTALRGLQGGVLMFGMVGNLVGLAVAGPALIGIGVVMSGRSLIEERRRQVTARRQQSRQAVRTYIDDVTFHIGKDVRDALRLLQRGLRDHLTERAATVQRTVAEALDAAQDAVARERSQTEARRADVQAELDRLRRLRERVDVAFVQGGRR